MAVIHNSLYSLKGKKLNNGTTVRNMKVEKSDFKQSTKHLRDKKTFSFLYMKQDSVRHPEGLMQKQGLLF